MTDWISNQTTIHAFMFGHISKIMSETSEQRNANTCTLYIQCSVFSIQCIYACPRQFPPKLVWYDLYFSLKKLNVKQNIDQMFAVVTVCVKAYDVIVISNWWLQKCQKTHSGAFLATAVLLYRFFVYALVRILYVFILVHFFFHFGL